jgi:hypothetical protein
VEASRAVARCHALLHRGYLSKQLVEAHGCITKKCCFLEKLEHEYWQEFREMERKKKRDRDALVRSTLERSGHIHVTAIREEKNNLLVISYIYDRAVDLSWASGRLHRLLGKDIKLQARTGSEEAIEQLIRKPRRETRKVTDVRKAPQVGNAARKRLAALGVYCLEDLYGRDGDELYKRDCEMSGKIVNHKYLAAYRNAAEYANTRL